MFGEVKKVGWL
jgi:hypothetical protein